MEIDELVRLIQQNAVTSIDIATVILNNDQALALAFAITQESKLETISINTGGLDDYVLGTLLAQLKLASQLKTLNIHDIHDTLVNDNQTPSRLQNVIELLTSLKIENLCIESKQVNKSFLDEISDTLQGNKSVRYVEFVCAGLHYSEDLSSLLNGLAANNTILSLVLTFPSISKVDESRKQHFSECLLKYLSAKNQSVTGLMFRGVNLSLYVEPLCQGLQFNTSIQSLTLNNCSLSASSDDFSKLYNLLNEKSYSYLDMSNNTITQAGLKMLAKSLKYNTSLKELRLNYCCIDGVIAKETANDIITCEELDTLEMAGNSITDTSSIANIIVHLEKLKRLNLSGTLAGANDIYILINAIVQNTSLIDINLGDNAIEDGELTTLSNVLVDGRHLINIDVNNHKCNESLSWFIERLKESLYLLKVNLWSSSSIDQTVIDSIERFAIPKPTSTIYCIANHELFSEQLNEDIQRALKNNQSNAEQLLKVCEYGTVASKEIVDLANQFPTVSPYCTDRYGRNVLHIAVQYLNKELVTFFIEKYPLLLTMRDKRSLTPLCLASQAALNQDPDAMDILQIVTPKKLAIHPEYESNKDLKTLLYIESVMREYASNPEGLLMLGRTAAKCIVFTSMQDKEVNDVHTVNDVDLKNKDAQVILLQEITKYITKDDFPKSLILKGLATGVIVAGMVTGGLTATAMIMAGLSAIGLAVDIGFDINTIINSPVKKRQFDNSIELLLAQNYNRTQEDDQFKAVVNKEFKKLKADVKISANTEGLIKGLPKQLEETTRKLLSEVQHNLNAEHMKTRMLMMKLNNQINKNMHVLYKETIEIKKLILQQAIDQNKRAKLEKTKRKVQSAIFLTTFFIDKILKMPQFSRELNVVANAALDIYCAAVTMGPVGITAVSISSALKVADTFKNSKTFEETVVSYLEQLSDFLTEMHKQIMEKFINIEERLIELTKLNLSIYKMLSTLMPEVIDKNYMILDEVRKIYRQMQSTYKLLIEGGRQSHYRKLKNAVIGLDGLRKPTTPLEVRDYHKYMNTIYSFAVLTAMDVSFTGNFEFGSTAVHAVDEVNKRKFLELTVGLFNALANETSQTSHYHKFIVNPVEWSKGVHYYLQRVVNNPSQVNQSTSEQLQNLYKEGLRIKKHIEQYSSKTLITSLLRQYKKHCASLLHEAKLSVNSYKLLNGDDIRPMGYPPLEIWQTKRLYDKIKNPHLAIVYEDFEYPDINAEELYKPKLTYLLPKKNVPIEEALRIELIEEVKRKPIHLIDKLVAFMVTYRFKSGPLSGFELTIYSSIPKLYPATLYHFRRARMLLDNNEIAWNNKLRKFMSDNNLTAAQIGLPNFIDDNLHFTGALVDEVIEEGQYIPITFFELLRYQINQCYMRQRNERAKTIKGSFINEFTQKLDEIVLYATAIRVFTTLHFSRFPENTNTDYTLIEEFNLLYRSSDMIKSIEHFMTKDYLVERFNRPDLLGPMPSASFIRGPIHNTRMYIGGGNDINIGDEFEKKLLEIVKISTDAILLHLRELQATDIMPSIRHGLDHLAEYMESQKIDYQSVHEEIDKSVSLPEFPMDDKGILTAELTDMLGSETHAAAFLQDNPYMFDHFSSDVPETPEHCRSEASFWHSPQLEASTMQSISSQITAKLKEGYRFSFITDLRAKKINIVISYDNLDKDKTIIEGELASIKDDLICLLQEKLNLLQGKDYSLKLYAYNIGLTIVSNTQQTISTISDLLYELSPEMPKKINICGLQ